VILDGKTILVSGVVNRHSIAYAIAERAQEEGATVLLTSFGRVRRMTERAAARLDPVPEILEFDATSEKDVEGLTGELADRVERIDGVVHAIAFAPPDAIGGDFLAASRSSALLAFEASAYSLKALTQSAAPLMPDGLEDGARGSIVTLDFDASVAWPAYDWMGVAKAGLEAVTRYLARDLGGRRIRVNSLSAGPIKTPAASGIPGFAELADGWDSIAPLGWNGEGRAAVADAAMFLLSDLSRGVTGELLHVDGGVHAIGPAGGGPDVKLS
jgi:meromycolic acid enoyl-[acyl-carrier-protein] reductase